MFDSDVKKTADRLESLGLSECFKLVPLGENVECVYQVDGFRFVFFIFMAGFSSHLVSGETCQVKFSPLACLPAPFAYPVLSKGSIVNENDFVSTPTYSYNSHLLMLDELVKKGLFLLGKAGLPAELLPQFIALTCCRINDNGLWFELEGKVKFTTIQVLKYLQKTDNVGEVVQLWKLGVLPEMYEDFVENYQDAPKEWVEIVYGENVRKHWESVPVNDLFANVRRKGRKRR